VIMVGLLPYYLVPDHYQLFLYILAGLQLVFLLPLLAWRLPESPRWLEARGRHEDADRVMTQIEDRVRRYAGELPAPAAQEHQVLETGHAPMFELFQGEYAKRTILLLLCWILGYGGIIYGFAAYALVYFVDRGYDAHFTFLTSLTGAIVAAAALLVNSFWGEKVERRDTILLGATLFLIAVFFVYGTRGTATLVAGYYVARIGASLWLFNMYTYTANAYPTRLRAIGTGWTDGVGHLGAWGGSILAGTFYAIGPDHLGWFILIAVPGAIIPALLLRGFGLRQRQAVLEKLSA
jgi:MFS family permease